MKTLVSFCSPSESLRCTGSMLQGCMNDHCAKLSTWVSERSPFCALQQYYRGKGKWEYMPVVGFAKAFDQTDMAQHTRGTLAQPYEAPNPKCDEALIQYKYALSGEFLPLTLLHRWHYAKSCSFMLMGSYLTRVLPLCLHYHFQVRPVLTENCCCCASMLMLNLCC